MPRKKFSIAPDAAARRVDCTRYDPNGGAPRCRVCNHPWCLAPGESQLTCGFYEPPTTEAEESEHGENAPD